VADSCDIAAGVSVDLNGNGMPDECEPHVVYVDAAAGNNALSGFCSAGDGGTCGPKRTIQAGIDLALAGYTVVVADGVYVGTGNKDLDFHGRAITVRSANGPQGCIIDCGGSGRGVYFHSGESADAVLDGFTIQNGRASGTGLQRNGGGIQCDGSSPTIRSCHIVRNRAARDGAGIACFSSSAQIASCLIAGNVASEDGGGLACFASSPTIVNCIFAGNVSAFYGGAVYRVQGSPLFVNCTLMKNVAAGYGGGIFTYSPGAPVIVNSILWGDTAPHGPELAVVSLDYPSTLTIRYSDVEGGPSAAYLEPNCTVDWQRGNMAFDPLLARLPDPGSDLQWGTPDDNYGDPHLTAGSPCVDAGSNVISGLPSDDFEGDARVRHCRVDMGADESPFFGDCNGNGIGDACDIAQGTSTDINGNGVPDECEAITPTLCPGDMNCDGAITFADIDAFVEALGGESAWTHWPCPWLNADCNSDSGVTFADIDPFVTLIGTTCP